QGVNIACRSGVIFECRLTLCQIAGRKLLAGFLVQPVQEGLTGSLCRACDVKMAEHERLRETRT
ncbi:hypothetical protein, partial [Komagataeibacter swingsii]|uniref:hypothetical protein n=1 Tax=Komagataeibacter swingsii TaxID=215220 RepID=UPI002232C29C